MTERQGTEGSPQRSLPDRINTTSGNVDPLGISFDRLKYPAYAEDATRISSFKDWPLSMTQSPRDLALAGFLYAGYGDYTRCFHCGVKVSHWSSVDEPWREHEVLAVLESTANVPFPQGNENLSSVQSVSEMGCSRQKVKEPGNQPRHARNTNDIPGSDLLQVVLSNEEDRRPLHFHPPFYSTAHQTGHRGKSETSQAVNGKNINKISVRGKIGVPTTETNSETNLESPLLLLTEENKRLKYLLLCKICLENDASIAVLPCGHLCCCADCAPATRKCPICRQFVKGTLGIRMV